jgi:hypothetical protein
MRFRDTIICSVCIVLAGCLLVIAGMRLDYINSKRQQMELISNAPLENAPPSLAFATVAMGAFRGLVVDVLWLRADRLKEQGQFFDAKQLAEWITTLQPRFASVWEFQAWNMAYNISVSLPSDQPQERWRWVKNGYELLRDKGIPLNPHSISLYRELGRIFQHKIGSVSDDAHKYYKLQLVEAMEPLLGPADNAYFESLAAAPTEWQQIIKDADTARLIAALKSADKAFADDAGFVNNYLSLRQNPGRFDPAAFRVIDSFRATKTLEKFDIFAKAWYLRNVWKLDPVLMNELNHTYGPVEGPDPNVHLPLDWRHPDTHAIYWAVKGLKTAGKEKYSAEETNTDRIVSHSLQNLFRYGKIFLYDVPADESAAGDPNRSGIPRREIFLRSDLRMFEPYDRSQLAIIEKYKKLREASCETLQNGHKNMLKNAIFSFYQAGHINQAQKIYEQLGQLYPQDEFKVPLVIFVRNRLREELTNITITNAREIIQMMLREGYFRYAVRDDDEAYGQEKMAREVYDNYQSAYLDENRIDLPDFKLLRYFALLDFLNDSQYPANLRRNLLSRIKVEKPQLFSQLQQQELEMQKQQSQ